jgi:hypothetical protein
MIVITDDEQKINELFIRLNSSKPLVGAEIRNAMIGEVPGLIRDIVAHKFWLKTGFKKDRGQDKNIAAKLLLLEHAGTFVDTKKSQLDNLVKKVNSPHLGTGERSASSVADEEFLGEERGFGDEVTPEDVADAAENAENSDIARSSSRVLKMLSTLDDLILDGDAVLSQQAQIPVVYWLCRESDRDHLPYLRSFLQKFDQERSVSKGKGDLSGKDASFAEFELMARTSNDQASIAGRYRIMREKFEQYVSAQAD